MDTDVAATIITVALWGSYLAPTKKAGLTPLAEVTFLSLGNLVFSATAFLISGPSFQATSFLYSFLAGLVWSVGGVFAFVGIKYLGITRGPGIWNPGKIILTTAFGVAIFGEIVDAGASNLLMGSAGILLLAMGFVAIVLSREETLRKTDWRNGIISVIIVSLFWSAYTIPLKVAQGQEVSKILPMAIGMFLPVIILDLSRHEINPFPGKVSMTFSGIIWGIANYTSLIMFQAFGIGRGFALSQLAIVINTLWGVLVFREVKGKDKLLFVALGISLSIVGGYIVSITQQ